MAWEKNELQRIYDRSSGYCHLCQKKLARKNYGINGARGAWHVEHSIPRARGGTDHLNNLYPACIQCNLSKGTANSRVVRKKNGKQRSPLSREARAEAKLWNAIGFGTIAWAVARAVHPGLGVLGLIIGAHQGHRKNPDR